jgi:crcB protein
MAAILDCVFVGAGGALGAICRYLLGLVPVRQTVDFPLTTLGINLAGAFCIGLLAALAGKRADLDPRLLLFLKVGVCGGFTTFSTFSLESAQLLQSGRTAACVLYIALSVLLCVSAALGAQALVR